MVCVRWTSGKSGRGGADARAHQPHRLIHGAACWRNVAEATTHASSPNTLSPPTFLITHHRTTVYESCLGRATATLSLITPPADRHSRPSCHSFKHVTVRQTIILLPDAPSLAIVPSLAFSQSLSLSLRHLPLHHQGITLTSTNPRP